MVPDSAQLPLPPPDPALPALGSVLTAADAATILASHLVRPGNELTACIPCYVRYKPGQSCLILYRLILDGHGEHLAHLRLYAGDRAARVWKRREVERLAASIRPEHLRGAAYVDSLRGFVQAYPLDVELPSLARLAAAELVRYKPARKALLHGGAVYTKTYADERGSLAYAAGRALKAAGVPVATPIRYSSHSRTLVQAAMAGAPLSSTASSPRYLEEIESAGAALARLHRTPVANVPRHNWRADLTAAAWAVGVVRPDLTAPAERLADRLSTLLESSFHADVTGHGDFYDDQVLVGEEGVVLLDIDRITRGDPALDLGTFLAHAKVRGWDGAAREALLAGYGSIDEGRLRLAEAAAVLKLAVGPFRVLHPDWPNEVERRLRLATECACS